MTNLRWIAVALCAALLGGCGGNPACDEDADYKSAVEGHRIVAPEGLDPLQPDKEMKIPEASPQPESPPGKCLELPPAYQAPDH